MEDLARAAEYLDSAGLAGKASAFRRKIANGKSFLEFVREGMPAMLAAEKLVSLLNKERGQREAISSRLAKRAQSPIDTAEIGAPHYNERS